MTKNIELINIARMSVDLIKGNLNIELDSLTKILIDNYHTKIDSSSNALPVLKILIAHQIHILMK